MTPQTVIACIIIIIAFAAYSRRIRGESDDSQYYDSAELTDAIRALYALSEQLCNADRMLSDLNACNPRELLRGFRAHWCGIDGKRHSINFLADGTNQTTAGLKAAAQEERDRLNAEIIDTIRAMQAALDAGTAPALRVNVVDETVDETTDTADAGEW